ncbi:MAG: secretin N-terminal domain-containing protein [Burkholderiaceae bacterium]
MNASAIARPSRTRGALWCALVALATLAGCAEQRLHDRGEDMLAHGDYEAAVASLEVAAREHPDSAQLRSDAVRARTQALESLVAQAAQAREQQRFDDAAALLARARRFDSEGQRIDPLLAQVVVAKRQAEALMQAREREEAQDLRGAARIVAQALDDDPREPRLLAEQRRLEQLARERQPRGIVHLKETRPISLDFRDASLRTVLDAVSRNSGVNFVLDKDLRSDVRVTIFLHDASVEDAIDLLVSTNQLARKMIDAQTMLIYPNTPDKQRDYQEQVVRVFYLTSTDAKNAAAFLKSMLKVHEPFVDERSNMLALRDTPENIELAQRLLALYDTADPEVTLELEVLEISSTKLTDLGLAFPNSVSLTPLAPSGAAGLTLDNISRLHRGDIGVDVGSLVLNLRREVGDTKTLANPRIRVRSREKAKVMIGDKVPVITTTTGQTGFVSDNVSYVDVGLQLEVEPTVYADDDVAIKLGLEVSSVTGQVKSANGTLAYQIGTRNANTMLRLHDGQTQLLAGLISHDEQTTSTRVPGLGDLPVLGRLFSSQLDNGSHSELVLAVTPHIVRNVRRPDAEEAELWIGTEAAPRLRTAASRRGAAPASAASGAAAAIFGAPAAAVPMSAPAPAASAASQAAAQLKLVGPASVRAGEAFEVSLDLDAAASLRGLPVQLSYDRAHLALEMIEEGGYFSQDGARTSFTQNIQPADGIARAGVLRNAATSVAGHGTVYRLRFKALAAGGGTIAVTGVNPIGLGGEVAVATPAPLAIAVK